MREGDLVLRTSVGACLIGGLLVFLALDRAGHPSEGLALATGLVIGSANGFLAQRALRSGISFWATSLVRLAILSTAGAGVALLLYPTAAWLVLLGIGAAQLVMAGVAVREALRG